jgi:hypothetical protein
MRRAPVYLCLVCALILVAGALPASTRVHDLSTRGTLENIEAAQESGVLTPDEAALNRIYHIFDRDKIDRRFLMEGELPGKCATSLISSILGDPEVSATVKDVLNEYMNEPFAGRAQYISPSGIFQLTYYTTGGNAVPAADENSNGVPDFVEWCADYMDYSWQVEITENGFMAPSMPSGYYSVAFEAMDYYGYTQPIGGTTRIVLHNTYIGFPSNDDPDGDVKGAAKVTCCHEFKHASQYTNSHWSEGGWVELDATWAEELVYPVVNDYHWYLMGTGSPLSSPDQSLDSGGTGSYEDCIWQQFMSETCGNQIITELWDFRRSHTTWSMLDSYNECMLPYGSDLGDVMGSWTSWNYLTGSWGVAGYGYPDGPELRTVSLWRNQSGLGTLRTSSVPHLAARYARHYSLSGLDDYPKVVFTGSAGVNWRPQIVVRKTDDTIIFDSVSVDGTGSGEKTVDIPFSEISQMGITFPNCDQSGVAKSYSYQLFSVPNTGVEGPLGYADMRLHPAFPNPFNPKTTIRFELAAERVTDLTIVSPGGRVVRHLLSGEVREAGEHQVTFDGKDNSGNDLPSGIYFAMLSVGGRESQLAKLTLLK